jgi:hypothetical protein
MAIVVMSYCPEASRSAVVLPAVLSAAADEKDASLLARAAAALQKLFLQN